jgi:transposase-like protein
MANRRRQHDGQFKFRVALEAAKGDKTVSQLASETGVHPSQIGAWKRQLLDGGSDLFNRKNDKKERAQAAQEVELYEQIGRLKMELEWLKKKATPFA